MVELGSLAEPVLHGSLSVASFALPARWLVCSKENEGKREGTGTVNKGGTKW